VANTNVLTEIITTLLAQALPVLRESAFMPLLINHKYEASAGEKFSTIDIPIASAIVAQDVAPGPTPPDNAGVTPTSVPIAVDTWKDASFFLSDKDMLQVKAGVIPMQAAEAVKALANAVNASIWALYTKVYSITGVPGTTAFETDLSEAVLARKKLNQQLAAKGERRIVLDSDAMGNALLLRAIQDQSWRQNESGIIEGVVGRTLGFHWFEDETSVPTHTTAAAGTPLIDDAGAVAVGVKTIHMDGFTTKPAAGDIFTIAGDAQQYVVTGSTTLAGTDSDVAFEPGLRVAIATGDGNEAVTFVASHVAQLAFHRDAFAIVSRPFVGADPMNLGHFDSIVDEESGLVLRLEISRQHKRNNFAFDILWGAGAPLPAYATRVAG
jgi:hypothetical protein